VPAAGAERQLDVDDTRWQQCRPGTTPPSHQDALIRPAAEVEGTGTTEFTAASTMSHAIDAVADRLLFTIDNAAFGEFPSVLDRPVSHV